MTYYIAMNRPTDLAAITIQASAGASPRHSMAELARALDAVVHDGRSLVPDFLDKLVGKATGMSPLWWAIARQLRREVVRGDVIFCTGEDIGFPVAALCGERHGVRVVVVAHRVDSAKKRVAIRLLGLCSKVARFIVVARTQAEALRSMRGLARERVQFIWDQTDTVFFSPGPPSTTKRRPVVMSVGLERRDYSTLAEATHDLDIDVRISGFSADTRTMHKAFPPELPANMSRKFYSWTDLRQLYRDADVVVVSVFPNRYAAGVQGLMEALASGRPVVVTATEGLEDYIRDEDAIRVVRAGDADGMRAAIQALLGDSAGASRMAARAHELAQRRHRCEGYVEIVSSLLVSLRSTMTQRP